MKINPLPNTIFPSLHGEDSKNVRKNLNSTLRKEEKCKRKYQEPYIIKDAIRAVKERIEFYSLDNQIKTYINLKFEEILLVCKNKRFREIIIGSKNNTTQKDIELLLDKQELNGIKVMRSKLAYR